MRNLLRFIISVTSHSHTCQSCGTTYECVNDGAHVSICPRCSSTKTTGH